MHPTQSPPCPRGPFPPIEPPTMRKLAADWLASHADANAEKHKERARDLAIAALRQSAFDGGIMAGIPDRTKLETRARQHLLRGEVWQEAAALARSFAETEGGAA